MGIELCAFQHSKIFSLCPFSMLCHKVCSNIVGPSAIFSRKWFKFSWAWTSTFPTMSGNVGDFWNHHYSFDQRWWDYSKDLYCKLWECNSFWDDFTIPKLQLSIFGRNKKELQHYASFSWCKTFFVYQWTKNRFWRLITIEWSVCWMSQTENISVGIADLAVSLNGTELS